MGMSAVAAEPWEEQTNPGQPATLRLVPLVPEGPCGVWRTAPPRRGESCRWQRGDDEWVVVALGEGGELGRVVLRNWRGQAQWVDSYEAALRLARVWCR